MKSLREHLTEALADRNGVPKKFNKNLHAKMVRYASDHIQGVADDIEQGVHDAERMMGKHNAGSVYHGVEDHLADHLHDTFHKHPGYGDGGYSHGGVSLARHVSKLVTKKYIHDDRPEYNAAVAKHKRREAAKNRPARPRKEPKQRASSTPSVVQVYTKSGTLQRTMKLPPWRKANESVEVGKAGPAKLASYGSKGDSVTATDIASHLRKRASEYKGSDSRLVHKLANEVEKHGDTSANNLIAKHKHIARIVGMEPSAAHNLISGSVK